MEIIRKREAIALLGLDEKTFNNYYKNAAEFECLPRQNGRGAIRFDKDKLIEWKASYDWRTLFLTREDYQACLDFALAMHFRGYVTSDWGTGRQREFGQKLTNWIKGQLGELAAQRFLRSNFNVEAVLDFDLHTEIIPQDIIKIEESGSEREPKLKVGIKSTKPKNAYLVLGENEITRADRKSDVYIYCRVDMPDDHILRIAKDAIALEVEMQRHYNRYKEKLMPYTEIFCEVAGYCYIEELEEVTGIPGQEFDGKRYVKQSGKLHRSKEEWVKLIEKL